MQRRLQRSVTDSRRSRTLRPKRSISSAGTAPPAVVGASSMPSSSAASDRSDPGRPGVGRAEPADGDAIEEVPTTAGGAVPAELTDRFGRSVRDLRLSVTDRCTLRCTYCMPEAGLEWLPTPSLLSVR